MAEIVEKFCTENKTETRFTHRDYKCLMIGPFPLGYGFVQACGYVNLPKEHKFHSVHYNDIDIDCHGGVTFSAMEPDGTWTIGFDMMHVTEKQGYSYNVKVTFDNLMKETCKMVDSLIDAIKLKEDKVGN